MYQKKLEKDIRCPLEYGLSAFGGKWKSRMPEDEKNVPFYEKHGFLKIGTRRDFYKFPREDAEIYEANLSETGT